MTLSDLPQEVQQELINERVELCSKWHRNTPYEVCFTNKEGTRYFEARRKQSAYSDDRGNYMPFGGGSQWYIYYGKILWDRRKNPVGEWDYYWVKTGQTFGKSSNGTMIPKSLGKKSEVIELAKNIGILVI